MKNYFPLLLGLLSATPSFGKGTATPSGITNQAQQATAFVENSGQITDQYRNPRADIQFSLPAGGINIFISGNALHYQFIRPDASSTQAEQGRTSPKPGAIPCTLYRLDVTLEGASQHPVVSVAEEQPYFEHYYNEHTGENGATAHTYKKLVYKDVYPHIDWVLYIKGAKLKHEFIVHEGGRPGDIKLKYAGADSIWINEQGKLTARTPLGSVTEDAPYVYAESGKVDSKYILTGNTVTYDVAPYKGELTIDPEIVWATIYGNIGTLVPIAGYSGAVDTGGNAYLAGEVSGAGTIATTGAYQTVFSGGQDAYIVKFSSAGTRLWATYYGGPDWEEGTSVATDQAGNILLSGHTQSTSGISSTGAYQAALSGDIDCYIAKFNSSGTRQWATYFGGIGQDISYSVKADRTGNIIMVGATKSASGIATAGAFQTVYASPSLGNDGFIAKFSPAGTRLWSTYFGGESDDDLREVMCDSSKNIYVTGGTKSNTGIASATAFQLFLSSGYDAMLAKFDSAGNRIWSTYYGSVNDDYGYAGDIDKDQNIYFGGITRSAFGLSTPAAHQASGGGDADGFLAKFNPGGDRIWSTYYGGALDDFARGIATDSDYHVYITGSSWSPAAIATTGALQTVQAGMGDAFIAKFDSGGARQWGTYLGGSGGDAGAAIGTYGHGIFYFFGDQGAPTTYPTPGSYSVVNGVVGTAFVARFDSCAVLSPVITGPSGVCIGSSITLSGGAATGVWAASNANAAVSSGAVTGITAGTVTINYSETDACGVSATRATPVTVNPLPAAIAGIKEICTGQDETLSTTPAGGTWHSSNTAVVSVNSSGVEHGVAAGTAVITYTLSTGCTAATIVTVNDCTTGVSSVNPDEAVDIYPNPATRYVYVENLQNGTISIININGSVAISQHITSNQTMIDLAKLPAGIYILKAVNKNSTTTRKLIKQ